MRKPHIRDVQFTLTFELFNIVLSQWSMEVEKCCKLNSKSMRADMFNNVYSNCSYGL